MFVSKDFRFEAAHFLTQYYGKCEKLHGHSYKLRVTVSGDVGANGLVLDFAILKRIVRRLVVDRLDHTLLNDLIDNPSAERVVMWIWNELKDFRRLLREEIADPNLAEDLRGYIQSDAAPDLTSSDISQVKLYEIQLWETEDSFVTYRGDL